MPETRYQTIETFDGKGNLIETKQIPYQVSDGELEMEVAERTITKLSALSDNELTVPQAARFLKALARIRR